mmetsp:Transcript_27275/g.109240  ORF Transcript_27275/g.109240 Transcript_27275/m.109240 type:complete len:278 (+) Transcript_27275:691-1524(+)
MPARSRGSAAASTAVTSRTTTSPSWTTTMNRPTDPPFKLSRRENCPLSPLARLTSTRRLGSGLERYSSLSNLRSAERPPSSERRTARWVPARTAGAARGAELVPPHSSGRSSRRWRCARRARRRRRRPAASSSTRPASRPRSSRALPERMSLSSDACLLPRHSAAAKVSSTCKSPRVLMRPPCRRRTSLNELRAFGRISVCSTSRHHGASPRVRQTSLEVLERYRHNNTKGGSENLASWRAPRRLVRRFRTASPRTSRACAARSWPAVVVGRARRFS